MMLKRKPTTSLLRHLLSMASLNQQTIEDLFVRTEYFLEILKRKNISHTLDGKIVTNLFFEPSTRTRNSFEIAAKRLSAIVLSPNMALSATAKGESLIDTIHTFEQLGTDIFVIRHHNNHTAQFVASELLTSACVINAGDGTNEHPTQTLLDLFTIKQHKQDFKHLTVAIIGDVLHSRVARSLIVGLNIMQTEQIRLIAPPSFLPEDVDTLKVAVYETLAAGLEGADVILSLRIQKERLQAAELPDYKKYFKEFGLTQQRLTYAKPNAIVLHPGPINRGVEIESQVADGPRSVILEQVHNGLAMRMAIMDALDLE